MARLKLKILTPPQYEFLFERDPKGFYDHATREKMYRILEKLERFRRACGRDEARLLKTYQGADLGLLLPEGYQSEGPLTSSGSVCLEGLHEGDVAVDGILIITEKGSLRGNLSAKSVFCKGNLVGDVAAASKVRIYPSGMVIGNIGAPAVLIESGAMFKGQCQLGPVPQVEPEPRRKSVVGQLFGVGFLGLR